MGFSFVSSDATFGAIGRNVNTANSGGAPPPPAAFAPTDLGASLAGWWRASESPALSGTTRREITQLTDKTSNARNLINVNPYPGYAPALLANMQNGKDGFYKPAVDNYPGTLLTNARGPGPLCPDLTTPFWWTIVLTMDPAATGNFSPGEPLYGFSDQNYVGSWFSTRNGKIEFVQAVVGGSNQRALVGSTVFVTGHTYIIQIAQDSAGTAAGVKMWVNGVAEAIIVAGDVTGTSPTIVNANSQAGWGHNSSHCFGTGCLEIVAASVMPTNAQVAGMDTYLNSSSLYAVHA